jgi:hypothetical protein
VHQGLLTVLGPDCDVLDLHVPDPIGANGLWMTLLRASGSHAKLRSIAALTLTTLNAEG